MAEATVSDIKPYKPKRGELEAKEDKIYEFEVIVAQEILDKARPVDKNTGLPIGNGHRASSSVPHEGIAWNPRAKDGKGAYEKWRYIDGQPSPFISEQPELKDYEKEDIDKLLYDSSLDFEWKEGKMLVRGDAMGKLKIQCLILSDYFVDNQKPYIKRTTNLFRLNNPDAIVADQNEMEDLAFKTMTQARNCTITEMLAASFLLGINIEDTSPVGINRIKHAFLNKAKYDAKNPKGMQTFIEILNNPTTKTKYVFAQGLLRGILSTTQRAGKLTWAKLGTVILDLEGNLPTADELTVRVIDKEKIVVELLAQVEAQLNDKNK